MGRGKYLQLDIEGVYENTSLNLLTDLIFGNNTNSYGNKALEKWLQLSQNLFMFQKKKHSTTAAAQYHLDSMARVSISYN